MNLIENIVPRLPSQLKKLSLQTFPPPNTEMLPALVQALENNTTLTEMKIDRLSCEATKHDIRYFGKRNKYRPLLAQTTCSKARMVKLFRELDRECWNDHESAVSVFYDTLRTRNDWKEDIGK